MPDEHGIRTDSEGGPTSETNDGSAPDENDTGLSKRAARRRGVAAASIVGAAFVIAIGVILWVDFLNDGITVSVTNCRAKGDGVTDDRAAFQAALEAAGSGGQVTVPPGAYRVGSEHA